LVRRDPDYVDALQLLGDHYTQHGRYLDGLKVENISRDWNRAAGGLLRISRAVARSPGIRPRRVRAGNGVQLGYRDFRWLARTPTSTSSPATHFPRQRGQNPPDESQGR